MAPPRRKRAVLLPLAANMLLAAFFCSLFHKGDETLRLDPSDPLASGGEDLAPGSETTWAGGKPTVDIPSLFKDLKDDRKKQEKLEKLQSKHRSDVCALLTELEASRLRDIQRMSRLRERLRALPRTVQELEFDNHVEISRLCNILDDYGCPLPPEINPSTLDPLATGGTGLSLGGSTMPNSIFSSRHPSRPASPSPGRRASRRLGAHSPMHSQAESTPQPRTPAVERAMAGQRSPIAPRLPVDSTEGAPIEPYRDLLRSEVDGWQSTYELARIQGAQEFDRDITKSLRELRMKKEESLRELEYKFRARLRESSVDLDKELLQSRQAEFQRKMGVQCDIVENALTSEHQNLKLGFLNEIGDHWHDADLQLRKLCEDFRGALCEVTKSAEGRRQGLGKQLRDEHDRCIDKLVDKYIDELRYQYQSTSGSNK